MSPTSCMMASDSFALSMGAAAFLSCASAHCNPAYSFPWLV